MYKKFFMGIAAMAALTLVSCSSDDLNSLSDNSSKNEAISFDGYLGRSAVAVNGSRGSVLDKTALQNSTEGFGVFGNYSSTDGATPTYGENLFKNEKVTYSSSNSTSTKWAYTNTKYWPTVGHIDFLAYAPFVSGTTLTDSKINFTVADQVGNQKDLLWANATNKTKTDNPVKFTFNHALAKIGYTVKKGVADDNVTITLNKITLAGSATDPAKGAFYTDGTIDLSKANYATDLWEPSSSSAAKQNFEWFSGSQLLTSTSTFNPDKDYLFVIPQDFSQTNENADELYVIVEYTINYNTGVAATMTSKVSSKLEKKFLQGKAYTINLTIGLTKIDFDVTDVNGWVDDNTIPEIPME